MGNRCLVVTGIVESENVFDTVENVLDARRATADATADGRRWCTIRVGMLTRTEAGCSARDGRNCSAATAGEDSLTFHGAIQRFGLTWPYKY